MTCLGVFATGVSIAVMGCIVNGPGEMADADFGCGLASHGACYIFLPLKSCLEDLSQTSAICMQVCGRRPRQDRPVRRQGGRAEKCGFASPNLMLGRDVQCCSYIRIIRRRAACLEA